MRSLHLRSVLRQQHQNKPNICADKNKKFPTGVSFVSRVTAANLLLSYGIAQELGLLAGAFAFISIEFLLLTAIGKSRGRNLFAAVIALLMSG